MKKLELDDWKNEDIIWSYPCEEIDLAIEDLMEIIEEEDNCDYYSYSLLDKRVIGFDKEKNAEIILALYDLDFVYPDEVVYYDRILVKYYKRGENEWDYSAGIDY